MEVLAHGYESDKRPLWDPLISIVRCSYKPARLIPFSLVTMQKAMNRKELNDFR